MPGPCLQKAAEQGLPYLILDGTLISSDRCADKKTSRKGKDIDKRAIQHTSVSPATIGDLAKSVLTLTLFEHKMLS